jgi:hypothetical protein
VPRSTCCSLVGFARSRSATAHRRERAATTSATADTGGLLTVFLVLRAFASGCTALTGVEAVSNGVPAFEPPKSRNAATTLVIMGGSRRRCSPASPRSRARARAHGEDGARRSRRAATALSQIGLADVRRDGAVLLLQAFTAAILVLAANTAFNGFPVLPRCSGATAICRASSRSAATGSCSPTHRPARVDLGGADRRVSTRTSRG